MLDPVVLIFLNKLKQNNHRDWFKANKDEHDACRKKVIDFSSVRPALNIVDNWRVKNTKLVRGTLFLSLSIERLNLFIKGTIKSKDVSLSLILITDKFCDIKIDEASLIFKAEMEASFLTPSAVLAM